MSTYHFQPNSQVLEEPSESRASAKGPRNVSRSQSPGNSLRQSAAIFNNPYGQQDFNSFNGKAGVSEFGASPNANYPSSSTPPPGSGNNNLTVDFLLQKVDDLLKQSQTPVKPQFNQQARQEAPSYSQANPFGQNPTANLRQSITSENGKQRKNDIFVKKSYEVPRDSHTLMTNPAKDLQSPKPAQNELFPIQESLRNSTLSIGATKSPIRDIDIQNDMGEIRSKLSTLENQLNAVRESQYNKSAYNDPFITPRSQSIPPSRTDPLFSSSAQPAQQYESIKKSPYIGEDYLSYSVEKPKSQSAYGETNPKKDAEVSEQICQTIDHLIQTHLLRDRSPSKSTLMSQRSYYTSPTRQPYDPANNNSLYKSSILPRDTEPVHKSSAPQAYSYQSPYNATEPTYKSSQPLSYSQIDYKATEPVYKSSAPLLTSPSYQSTYEPYSVYESRYNEPAVSKYEPYRPYEPVQSYETKSTYEPLPAYETRSRYDPLPSYDRAPSYDKDLKSSPYSSSYTQRPLGGDYDGSLSSRSRPRYVRPLHRNSPPKYGSQNNYSASGSKYTSPHSNDYFNKNSGSGLSTPKRENPYSHQDTSSTDRKMKKLTLKSKVSEEKDYESKMDLPRQSSYGNYGNSGNSGKKGLERLSYKSSELLPDWEDAEREARNKNRQNFKSSELLPDNENDESDDISLRTTKKGTIASQQTQKKVRAAPTQAPRRPTSNKNYNNYKAGELESDDERRPNASDPVGELVDDSEGEEWEERDERDERDERENDLASERERERERVREKAREYEREQEREKERERVREQERQRMRQSQKVTRNVPDDGKAWGMVHKLPSSVFEDAENSFDFDVTQPKQRHETEVDKRHAVRASNTVKPKPALNQPRKESGKAMIWAMDEPVTRSQKQSLTNLSDSMRRTEKKPVITHVFEKSGRHGY